MIIIKNMRSCGIDESVGTHICFVTINLRFGVAK